MFSGKDTNSIYTIREASRMIGVLPHTLRYWDKVFPEILVPLRTPGGQRRYDVESIEVIREIFRLVRVEGYSIRGARRQLSKSHDHADC